MNKLFLENNAKTVESDKKKLFTHLWIANNNAKAATVRSPPDMLNIGWKRLPGATQLKYVPSRYGSSGFSGPITAWAD
jgi:hypothetical protein